jgi:hypothetical protein
MSEPRSADTADVISAEASYNRTLDDVLSKVPYAYYEARTEAFRKAGARTAYMFRDKTLVPIMYRPNKQPTGPMRNFFLFATAWECKHSTILNGDHRRYVYPLVDEHMTVIGHYGEFKFDTGKAMRPTSR